jgi:hypothetical protein
VGDLSPSPPVRIEAPSAGEERNARGRLASKPPKRVVVAPKEPVAPDVDLDSKEEKHQLDERA